MFCQNPHPKMDFVNTFPVIIIQSSFMNEAATLESMLRLIETFGRLGFCLALSLQLGNIQKQEDLSSSY